MSAYACVCLCVCLHMRVRVSAYAHLILEDDHRDDDREGDLEVARHSVGERRSLLDDEE